MLDGEASVVRRATASYDALALSGELAVWSDQSGTWVWTLSALKSGQPRRIAERCAGLAVLTDSGHWVACARPGPHSESEGDSSSVTLYGLGPALNVESTLALGQAGRDGRKVALALAGQSLHVAWEDGRVGAPSVRLRTLPLATLRAGGPLPPDRALSRPGKNGREPALLSHAGQLYASWSESELSEHGELHQLLVAREGEPPRPLLRVQSADPSPTLTHDDQGLIVGYRDLPRREARPELYVGRLKSDLTWLGKPRKLGRANSEGAPLLIRCGSTRAAIAPLEHGGELYVAFHPLSDTLSPLEENHQYYASGREFVLAGASCSERGVIALLAERSQPSKPHSELLKVEFRCAR